MIEGTFADLWNVVVSSVLLLCSETSFVFSFVVFSEISLSYLFCCAFSNVVFFILSLYFASFFLISWFILQCQCSNTTLIILLTHTSPLDPCTHINSCFLKWKHWHAANINNTPLPPSYPHERPLIYLSTIQHSIQPHTHIRRTNSKTESVQKLYPFPENYPSLSEAAGKEGEGEIHAKWHGKQRS